MAAAPLRILLVEDDEDDYLITRDLLFEIAAVQYDIRWEKTYGDGLAAIGQNAHDVALIDYRLGGESGIDIIREAVRLGSPAPTILLTGAGDRAIDMAAMEAGAAGPGRLSCDLPC